MEPIESSLSPDPSAGSRKSHPPAPITELLPADPTFADGRSLRLARGDDQGRSPQALDLVGVLKALRRRWRLGLLGGLISAVLVGGAAYLVIPPPKYSVSSLIYVAEKKPRDLFETKETSVAYRTYQDTLVILATSRKVLETALRRPEVEALEVVRDKPDPAAWLASQVKVDFPRNSEILTISMTGYLDPGELATLVNAVTHSYLAHLSEQERTERLERLERLKLLSAKIQGELKQKRDRFKAMAEETGSSNRQSVAARNQMIFLQLTSARQELLKLQNELQRAQARVNVLSAKMEVEPASNGAAAPRPLKPVAPDPRKQAIEERIAELKSWKAEHERVARKGSDPALVAAQREITKLSKQLRELDQTPALTGPTGTADEPGRGRLELSGDTRAAEAREYLEILQEQEKGLKEQIAELEKGMSALNLNAVDLTWLEEEISLVADTAKVVGTEVQSMTVEMQAPPRMRLIEEASTPTLGDPLRRYKFAGLAAVGTFFGFLGLLGLWEFQSRKIEDPDEVAVGLGLRVMGDLPRLAGPRRIPSREIQSHLIESIDAIRTMILNASRARSLRTIMITSAFKGEGKTSLSCHLATSLARAGRRTLLIDCDLRDPSVQQVFDIPRSPGLCEVLRGEVCWTDVVHQAPVAALSLIPAGCCDPSAIDALSRDDLPGLLQTIADSFDLVILDTSPVLLVTDSLILSQHVDAVVFSILREVSQFPQVQAAYQRLATLGAPVLGAVVSGVPSRAKAYYGTYRSRGPAG